VTTIMLCRTATCSWRCSFRLLCPYCRTQHQAAQRVVRDLNSGDGIGVAGQCLRRLGDYRPSAGTIIDVGNLATNDGMALPPPADARFRRRVVAQGSETESAPIRTGIATVTRVMRRFHGSCTLTRRSSCRHHGDDTVRPEAEVVGASHIGRRFSRFRRTPQYCRGHHRCLGDRWAYRRPRIEGRPKCARTSSPPCRVKCSRAAWPIDVAICSHRLAWNGCEGGRVQGATEGVVMVGLNSVVAGSHGGTDGDGLAPGVDVAMDIAMRPFSDLIRQYLSRGPTHRMDAGNSGFRRALRPAQPRSDTSFRLR